MSTDLNKTSQEVNNVYSDAIQREKFNFSPKTVALLTSISNLEKQGNPLDVTNVVAAFHEGLTEKDMPEAVVESYNESLAILQFHRLISIGMDGKVRPTKAGENAVGSGVAVSYPVGKYGTISSYDDTFRTQTVNAGNAMLIAQSNNPTWFSDRNSTSLGALFNSLAKNNVFAKAPIGALLNFYERVTEHYVNDSSTLPSRSKGHISYSMAKAWKDIMIDNLTKLCIQVGEITLKNPVRVGAETEITKIDGSGSEVVCKARNIYTQESSSLTLSELTIDLIEQVRNSI